jgi:hypothetical protein
MPTDSLDWPLMVLARIDAEFTVEGPDELRDAIASAAVRFGRSAPAQAGTGAATGAS